MTSDVGKPVLKIQGELPVSSSPVSVFVPVLDPALNFLRHFRNVLEVEEINVDEAGVVVSGHKDTSILRGDEPELAAVESPTLSQLLIETNQKSNNLYAEALLRSLGASSKEASKPTADLGLAAVKQTLTGMGVDPATYVQADGSGLSRRNLISPEALVQTLRAIAQTTDFEVFRNSLPVAGVSGTLQNRFRNTPAQDILQAKTGTMTGVSALSGYLNPPNFQPLVLSIIVNQSDQSAPATRQAIDRIVLLLTRLHRC